MKDLALRQEATQSDTGITTEVTLYMEREMHRTQLKATVGILIMPVLANRIYS
jgi:hypothetical protein